MVSGVVLGQASGKSHSFSEHTMLADWQLEHFQGLDGHDIQVEF